MQIPDEQIYQLIGEIVVQHRKTALDNVILARELAEYKQRESKKNPIDESDNSAQ